MSKTEQPPKKEEKREQGNNYPKPPDIGKSPTRDIGPGKK